jgi:mRNA deadenylase 3'-5' endonuclease subunit Ccr4
MNKVLVFSFLLAYFGSFSQAQNQSLRVASYNLRYDNPGDAMDNWKYRKETVAKLIQFHDFDIFAAQEVLHYQLKELAAALEGFGYFGVGRDDGKGQESTHPYCTKRMNLNCLMIVPFGYLAGNMKCLQPSANMEINKNFLIRTW